MPGVLELLQGVERTILQTPERDPFFDLPGVVLWNPAIQVVFRYFQHHDAFVHCHGKGDVADLCGCSEPYSRL